MTIDLILSFSYKNRFLLLFLSGPTCEINIDECLLYKACRNNATCEDLLNDYRCTCRPGFTGKDCEINVNECESDPCLNGASCNDLLGGYTCKCVPGYTGESLRFFFNTNLS